MLFFFNLNIIFQENDNFMEGINNHGVLKEELLWLGVTLSNTENLGKFSMGKINASFC